MTIPFALRVLAISLAAAAAGCASTATETRSTTTTSGPAAQPTTMLTPVAQGDPPLVGPADARPGECYARVFNPAVYETHPEQVVKTQESERVEIVPAKYEEVQEQVLVKPATTRIEVVPAVYETVEEQVMVQPATTRMETVPAQFETVTERVMVKPSMWVWRRASEGASSNVTRVDPASGEVLCLVEIPAEYQTVTKQVIKSPATTRAVEVPAEYRTVTRQVLVTPATTREVEVPAEYATVAVTKMVEPARETRVPIPAEYTTVQRTVLAQPAQEEWRQVLCETNASDEQIRALQDALRAAGYDPGPSTGELSSQTQDAMRAYQAANNLPVDRGAYVNMKTASALGLADPASSPEAASPAQEQNMMAEEARDAGESGSTDEAMRPEDRQGETQQ